MIAIIYGKGGEGLANLTSLQYPPPTPFSFSAEHYQESSSSKGGIMWEMGGETSMGGRVQRWRREKLKKIFVL